ncbi:hypothetical protein MRB53_021725 [Persea americana]|uniref:Uncharacterized protein n=1 Tax=Persea americana TaxID=3435 RepID=A0ACC2L557_PERAE|nr:hypothetical protein MRB53_021725 [Persea americana]
MDQTLAGDQTISSKGDIFELGFFKLDVSTIASNSTAAELLDTGNFVLRDGSDSAAVIWQSFDHPTDTWLPKGWFGRNMITGEIKPLISWKNHEDPPLGMFSLQIDSNGNDRGSLLWNRSEVYWRGGIQNNFNRIIELNSGHFLNFSYFNKEGRNYLTYNPVNSSFITRALLDTSGRLQLCGWLESSKQWKCFWVQPTTQCEVYSLCGKFGVCTENSLPFCSCLRGFETKSMEDWNLSDRSAGCVRKTNLKCGYNSSSVGEKDGFLVIHNMRLPGNLQSLTVGSAKECELSYLSHYSCTAYAYKNGCSLWNGDLINLQQLSDGEGQDMFVRLTASELRSLGPKKRRIDEATLAIWFSLGLGFRLDWVQSFDGIPASTRHRRKSAACACDGTRGEDCYCEDRRTPLLLGQDDPGSILERRKSEQQLLSPVLCVSPEERGSPLLLHCVVAEEEK